MAEASTPLPKVGWVFEHDQSHPYFRQVGDNVQFVWTLTNTGSEPIHDARIRSDWYEQAPFCPADPQPLKTGEEIYCQHSQTATEADVTTGKMDHVAVALGSSIENEQWDTVIIPYRPDAPVIPPRFLLCEPGYCLDAAGNRLTE